MATPSTALLTPSAILSDAESLGLGMLFQDTGIPQGKVVGFSCLFSSDKNGGLSFNCFLQPQFAHNKTNTVILIRTADGHKFGAYTKTYRWGSMNNAYHNDADAFLFSLNQPSTPAPWKTNKPANANVVYESSSSSYIGFGGGHDLTLNLANRTVSANRSTFGGTYNLSIPNATVTCFEVFEVMHVNASQLRVSGFSTTSFVPFGAPVEFTTENCEHLKRELLKPVSAPPGSAPEDKGQIIHKLNIVVLGGSGAGKSSFLNSCVSAFSGRIRNVQSVRGSDKSVTKTLTHVPLSVANVSVPIVLWDTMGWDPESYKSGQLGAILDGNLPNKADLDKSPYNKLHGYVTSPTVHQKAHAACILVPAPLAEEERYISRVIDFRITCDERDITPCVILTKIDLIEPQLMQQGLSMTYYSNLVGDAVKALAQKSGISSNLILPVKNYESERNVNKDIDILLFDALMNLRNSAVDYISFHL